MHLSVSQSQACIAFLMSVTALSLRFVQASSNSSPSTSITTQSSSQYTHQPRQVGFPDVKLALEGADAGGHVVKIELGIEQAGQGDVAPLAAAGSPTMLPITPFFNGTESSDTTTTVSLPNGDVVEVEQHVNIAFGLSPLPTLPDLGAVDENSPAPPHRVSISLPSPAPPEPLIRTVCNARETVTVTRTAFITSTIARMFTKYVTSTRTVTREQDESATIATTTAKEITQVQVSRDYLIWYLVFD